MGSPRFHREQAEPDTARKPATPDAANAGPRLRIINPTTDRGRVEPSEGLIGQMTGDDALIVALSRGQPAALGALYDRHAQSVFVILVRIVGERAVAEELLQEVFLTAWQQAEVFDGARGTVGCWLRGIAHNVALAELRRRRRRPQPMVGRSAERDEDQFAGCVDPNPQPIDIAWRSDRNVRLAHAIDQLPPTQQVVLTLYAAGYSQSEIAAQLGAPLGTVKSRMRQGLARLRAALPALGIDADCAID
jgi:RNA polymerase sigma-70 factor (ECF subfamily)